MVISRISAQDATGTGSTSAVAIYPVFPQRGNLLIAASTDDVSVTTGVTGFTLAITVPNSSGTGSTSIWYKTAVGTEAAITSNKVTATIMQLAIYEYTGFAATAFLDKTVSSTSTAVTIPTGTTAATTAPDELIFAAGGTKASNTLTSWSNSFTAITTQSGAMSHFTSQLISTSETTFTTIATTTPTSALNQGCIATFRSLPQQLNNYQFVKVGDGMSSTEKIR